MLYFAYGSNLNLRQMARRCPDAEPVQAATLNGWRLCFKVHADIIIAPRAKVVGAVYRITPACEAALDQYEGFPNYYGKRYVQTASGETVMFYVIDNGRRLALPSGGYLATIIEGYREWEIERRRLTRALVWTERHRLADELEKGWLLP